MSKEKVSIIEKSINIFQHNEGGLYNAANGGDKLSKNLLHIINMKKLNTFFSVNELVVIKNGRPHSEKRTTSGGWSYVKYKGEDRLKHYL